MKVIVISGSPRQTANTQTMMRFAYDYAESKNEDTKFINLSDGGIDYFRGHGENYSQTTTQAAQDIIDADVWLVGTPIYNSFFSSALKNLFEYVNYKNTAEKTAGLAIMASGQINFTYVQTILTQLMSYFRVARGLAPSASPPLQVPGFVMQLSLGHEPIGLVALMALILPCQWSHRAPAPADPWRANGADTLGQGH